MKTKRKLKYVNICRQSSAIFKKFIAVLAIKCCNTKFSSILTLQIGILISSSRKLGFKFLPGLKISRFVWRVFLQNLSPMFVYNQPVFSWYLKLSGQILWVTIINFGMYIVSLKCKCSVVYCISSWQIARLTKLNIAVNS